MAKVELTQEEYDSLIYWMATLKAKSPNHSTLPKATLNKPGWWKTILGSAAVIVLVVMFLAIGAEGKNSFQMDMFQYYDGNGYMRASNEAQMGYVMGVVDSLSNAVSSGANYYVPFAECVKGKPAQQIKAVVDKYMKGNPQEWHCAMSSLVWTAVLMAFMK